MNIYSIDADMLCPSDEDGLIAPYETKVVCLSDHAAALAAKDAELNALQARYDKLEARADERADRLDLMRKQAEEANAEIERLRKDNSGLHEIQDLQREHIVERDRRIAALEKELAEARALADQQYQFALSTQTENESLREQLAAALLTGNPNAVNCDGLPDHPHDCVALIVGSRCPACDALSDLALSNAEIERLGKEYGQIALDWVKRTNERDETIADLRAELAAAEPSHRAIQGLERLARDYASPNHTCIELRIDPVGAALEFHVLTSDKWLAAGADNLLAAVNAALRAAGKETV